VASPTAFQSTKALAEGRLAQHCRTTLNRHQEQPGEGALLRDLDVAPGRRIPSEEEVLRWLRRLRYEGRYRKGRGRVPLKVVAEFVGLNRDTLYEAINGGKISSLTRSRLSWLIDGVERRQLSFRRRGQVWHIDYNESPHSPNPVQTISAPFGSIFGGPPSPPWKAE
jgi:hypothetical protein